MDGTETGESDRLCQRCGEPIINRGPQAKFCSHACLLAHQSERRKAERRRNRKPKYVGFCRQCGSLFRSTRRRKYCSDGCRRKAKYERNRNGTPPDRHPAVCPVCEIQFVTRRFNQTYCSPQCRWHALNKRRIDKTRRTDRPPFVSPQLAYRRAAAIRQKWSEGERKRRDKMVPEMPLYRLPPAISQAERVREHIRSNNVYGALAVASGWRRPGWLVEVVQRAWAAWQAGRRDGSEVQAGLEALRKHLKVNG